MVKVARIRPVGVRELAVIMVGPLDVTVTGDSAIAGL
jgi:hypothetical protein